MNSKIDDAVRPNILFVFPDQWRSQAVGFAAEDPVLTPHLDRFAAESLVLSQAMSNFPVCSPYRASMLTGKYPFRHGILGNCNSSRPGMELQESECCVSDILHRTGYSLGYIGKWHLEAPHAPYLPPAHGESRTDGVVWDEWTPPHRRHGFSFWHSYGAVDAHMSQRYWRTSAGRSEFHVATRWSPEYETDLAVEFIRNRGGAHRVPTRPFALWVSMNPPHPPFHQVPGEYVGLYAGLSDKQLLIRPNIPEDVDRTAMGSIARKYFAAITGVDEQFGRLLHTLQQEGLHENTIVVFTSDHGEMLGSHGLMGKNVFFDESMRVPFIVRWPAKLSPRRDTLLFSTPDIMPTLLGLTGTAVPPTVQGKDHSSRFLDGSGSSADSAIYMRAYNNRSLGDRGLRCNEYTFAITRSDEGRSTLLFDNQKDPFQMTNIAAECPSLVTALTEHLLRKLREVGDAWTPT